VSKIIYYLNYKVTFFCQIGEGIFRNLVVKKDIRMVIGLQSTINLRTTSNILCVGWKNGSFDFAKGMASCVGAKANVPFVGWQ